MKNMQDFHTWLSSANDKTAPNQRRLLELTRLSRVQLANAASALGWFLWDAPETASAA